MNVSARISTEIDTLASAAEKLALDAARSDSGLGPERVQELMSLASRGGELIRRLYQGKSQYQVNLDRVLATPSFSTMHSNYFGHVAEVAGVLKGVQSDVHSGMLAELRGLIQAEIFADFLEMAEHLLTQGYKDPAAVLLAAVLEDSLRKIADRHGVPSNNPNGRPLTIEPLNVGIAKAGHYNALVQKQITSWANLRNSAAHGRFEEYDADQVRQMLFFVQKFCAEHLK